MNRTSPKALPFCILAASFKTKGKQPPQPPWPHVQFWKGSISVPDQEDKAVWRAYRSAVLQ